MKSPDLASQPISQSLTEGEAASTRQKHTLRHIGLTCRELGRGRCERWRKGAGGRDLAGRGRELGRREGGARHRRAGIRMALDPLGAVVLQSIMALSGRLALAALRLWGPGGEPHQERHGVLQIGCQRCFRGR